MSIFPNARLASLLVRRRQYPKVGALASAWAASALAMFACSGSGRDASDGISAAGGASATSAGTGGDTSGGGVSGLGGFAGASSNLASGGYVTSGTWSTTGGTTSAGGASAGGDNAGGSASERGGTSAVGGTTVTGGTLATGGTPSAGGTKATGGSPAAGGTKATGGSTQTSTVGSGGGAVVPTTITWTNPIVPKRADPHVWLHTDGYYYLAATVPEYDRIELRRATTIGGLSTATAKVVWKRPASGEMAGPIWAPEIHPVDGKWYVYFSAGEGGQPWDSIRVFALENPSSSPLEGTWTARGQVVTKWDSFSLDATTFVHESVRYFVWTQVEPGKVGTNIMIAKMTSPTTLATEQVVLSRPQYTWETQGGVWVNEGPAALVKNGKVFITYSASATDANYCMGLLTASASSNLLDPKSWTKSTQPVFKSSDTTSQYGPGHNSFTTSPDGKLDILVYHARSYKDIPGGNALGNPDRATRAQVLTWNTDGTPNFGIPVAYGPYSATSK